MQEEQANEGAAPFAAVPSEPAYSSQADEPKAVDDTITWTASEYIAHHKSTRWYASLAAVAVVIALLVWFLTRGDVTSTAVVIIGAAILGAYGARKPRELEYVLRSDSLTIGAKTYELDGFRSFTVDDQQAIASVNLMPLKRFAPGLSIYFAPADESAILNILSARLPIEDHRPDPIDQLMKRIRF